MKEAICYIRLSKEDGETDSIQNQRLLLARYAADHGFRIRKEYIDDGYSGTDFARPAFSEMIRDLEHGFAEILLLKDLSRLGRNYLETGRYTEIWFPSHGIRCIAVCDGYDSEDAVSDLVPFRNLMNEMYARDISRKIRSALHARMRNGDFIGARAPYGYAKSKSNRHRLIPDPEKSQIVVRIFSLAGNRIPPSEIAGILNREGIASPSGGVWMRGSVTRILHNRVYLGESIQGKTRRPSLHTKSHIAVPIEEQIRVPGTHPALISEAQFSAAERFLVFRRC